MNFSSRHTFWRISALAAAGRLLLAASACFGQSVHLESAGARAGFYANGANSDFNQAEAFINLNLPWRWELGSQWHLQSRFDGSIGWLGEPGAIAGVVTVGPSLLLGRQSFPLSLEGGVSPTLLTRADFRTKDLGIPFQFTSHLGLNLDLFSRIRLGYRFQHMSNAGVGRHNPGLNMHMFGLSYLF